ncbi:L-iditol 2-dehydrogenase [Rhodococcus opacus PD630]|nr:L-iditol 2-dehydrogenase [Rhodococcus opacus PD630]
MPIAAPKPDEAVIRIAYGGICGSDLHYWQHGAAGESILRAPMRLGHEASGTVLIGATDGSGPGAGTPVTIHPATPGGDSAKYPADRPNISPGCTYLGSAAHFPHADGLFVSHVAVPTRMLRVLPDGLDLRLASLAEPASVAWHAVARAGEVKDRSVLVIGAGPIGALVVAVLKRAGAGKITAVDMHEYPLRIARAVGADATLTATDADAVAAVEADVTIECSRKPSRSGIGNPRHGPWRPGRDGRSASLGGSAGTRVDRDHPGTGSGRLVPVQRRDRRGGDRPRRRLAGGGSDRHGGVRRRRCAHRVRVGQGCVLVEQGALAVLIRGTSPRPRLRGTAVA